MKKSRSVSLTHLFERLAGVAGQDLVVALDQELPFLHLDDGVRGVAAEPARALVDHDPAVRQRVALALAPAASSTAAIDAAMPMQIVLTGARRYCIVS